MTHRYSVKGMTCNGCATNVKKALEAIPGVTEVIVQREASEATVSMEHHIETGIMRNAVKQYGNYELNDLQ